MVSQCLKIQTANNPPQRQGKALQYVSCQVHAWYITFVTVKIVRHYEYTRGNKIEGKRLIGKYVVVVDGVEVGSLV